MNTYAVILAGGSGTRFWPASRRLRPKQLLPVAPNSDELLLEATVRRLRPLVPPEKILVATGTHLVDAVRAALPAVPPSSVLGEPVARNTAPCIGWATQLIQRRDPDATVMVLPSDHHIADEAAFVAALERAVASAESGPITTIGLSPARPETGYGYIERGEQISTGIWRVARFVEKPALARAKEYVQSGRYFWNSGMFFFRAAAMLEAISEHAPALHAGLERIRDAARSGAEREREETVRMFEATESVSIDYAIMERVSPLNLVPAEFGWSDLGSWQAVWELSEKDPRGNALETNSLALDARRNLVRSLRSAADGRAVVLLGVDDLCVVDTDDALLVVARERAQDVRLVTEELRARGEKDKL